VIITHKMGGCQNVPATPHHQLLSQHPKVFHGILIDPIIVEDPPLHQHKCFKCGCNDKNMNFEVGWVGNNGQNVYVLLNIN
jgi:hypothetical protein